MANDISVPLNVLVINPRPNKLTRFILDCKVFDATTKITVTDPGISAPCAFDVISVVVLSKGPPTRLLVVMRFKKLPGVIGPMRPLTVKAETGTGAAAVTVSQDVTAYFHSRKAANVDKADPQLLKLGTPDEQPIVIRVPELGGIVSATIESSSKGRFEVSRTSYDEPKLTLMLISVPAGPPRLGVGPFVGISVTLNCDDDGTAMDPVPVDITFS